jgi:acyl carrier protein
MQQAELMERVSKVLCNELGIEEKQIQIESHLMNDLGADSLQSLEVIMSLEEEFDIIIPDEALDKIEKVSDIQKIVGDIIA